MKKTDKERLLEKIREEGYIIEEVDENDNVKSSKHVPPLTQNEKESMAKYKAVDKAKLDSETAMLQPSEETVKRIKALISQVIQIAKPFCGDAEKISEQYERDLFSIRK